MACTIFFSAMGAALPTTGRLWGLSRALPLIAVYVVTKLVMGLGVATAGVPLAIASLHWYATGRHDEHGRFQVMLTQLMLPLACMGLFALHAVGSQAMAYTLFWLIPAVLYVVGNRSTLAVAVSNTFIAHAVGSVIWLYAVAAMTPSYWLALIPTVAVERFALAAVAVVFYFVVRACEQRVSYQ